MRFWACSLLLCLVVWPLAAESAAGLQWTVPAGWKAEAPQPMRAATYTVPPSAGDTASGECGVYFFGAGQGGSVQANMDRWSGQFTNPDGTAAPAKTASRTINGLTVNTIDTSGSYSGMGGPMASGQRVVANYRLLGAIVSGPGGNVFVKFTGPARTVAANQPKFEQLLASFRRER